MNKPWWGKTNALANRRGKIPRTFHPDSILIQKSVQKGVPLPKTDLPTIDYGQHIYLYKNIQTSQVVYSLSRHLNNKDALDQLPYLGKKTIPPRLRKDLWSPLAMVYFPSHHAGLAAYRKLREFRRLHETTYDRALITDPNGKHAGTLLPIKKRGKILMDQKANSIADLAAVLWQQEKGPSEGRMEDAGRRIRRAEHLKKVKGDGKVKKDPVDVGEELKGVEGVSVRWADLLDAEFAEMWPEAVVHDSLQKSRHTAAWPAKEVVEEEEEEEELEMTPEPEPPGRGVNEEASEKQSKQEISTDQGNEAKGKGWLSKILPRRTHSATIATA